jgi:hypothetical protein
MNLLYFLGFILVWGGQVNASKPEPPKPETTQEATVTVTVRKPINTNDPVLEVKKGNRTTIYEIRGPESIGRNNGIGIGVPVRPSFAYGVIGDSSVGGDLDKPVKLVCGNNSAILKVSNRLTYNEVKVETLNITYTTDSEQRNFGKALCYFIEAYMPRVDNLSTGAGRAVGSLPKLLVDGSALFYKTHATYIFWAIETLIGSTQFDPYVLEGIWEYLVEYEAVYGYTGYLGNMANKAIYGELGRVGAAKNGDQARTILVPIFEKLANKIRKSIQATDQAKNDELTQKQQQLEQFLNTELYNSAKSHNSPAFKIFLNKFITQLRDAYGAQNRDRTNLNGVIKKFNPFLNKPD